jgi:hypothetical protein
MLKVNRVFAVVSLTALVAGSAAMLACGGAAESSQTSPAPAPTSTETTNPATGIKVNATIAAASLGGGGFGGGGAANVQIAFFASDATSPASIVITKVILLDAKSGATLDTLEASSPGVWNGRVYETWNEKVTPGGDLRASYALTTPDWSTIESGAKRTTGTGSYSITYKLRISMLIDGTEITLESEELQREPEVAT